MNSDPDTATDELETEIVRLRAEIVRGRGKIARLRTALVETARHLSLLQLQQTSKETMQILADMGLLETRIHR